MSQTQISPLKKNDPWSTCVDHDWQIDPSDWDGPPGFEYVICSKCECPGQRHIESGEVEWPTT